MPNFYDIIINESSEELFGLIVPSQYEIGIAKVKWAKGTDSTTFPLIDLVPCKGYRYFSKKFVEDIFSNKKKMLEYQLRNSKDFKIIQQVVNKFPEYYNIVV